MTSSYADLDKMLRALPGSVWDYQAEWGWERYLVGGKMFAATCLPGAEHGVYGGHKLLTLKCDPLYAQALCSQYADIHPAFYMNKTHWISIFLDGSVPKQLISELCRQSYQLVFHKLPKKQQHEITAPA